MKKIFLILGILFGITSTGFAKIQTVNQCQYTSDDAQKAAKNYKMIQATIANKEGNILLVNVKLHNPDSQNAQSVDAMALIMTDQNDTTKQTLLVIMYFYDERNALIFRREIKESSDGQKTIGACFIKEVVKK